ncbi:MAG: AI-2E family transporter [Clostridia bacterium]|nr:AI-2E family transporter [Clostridia bacterium]
MKIDWNKRYTTLTAYICIIITFAVVLVAAVMHLNVVWGAVKGILSVLNPFIIGFCIAFLINPLMMLFEGKVFGFIGKRKPRPKLKRVLSLIIAYIVVSILISLFVYMIVPQMVQSYDDLQSRLSGYVTGAQEFVTNFLDKDKTPIPEFILKFMDLDTLNDSVNDFLKNFYKLFIDFSPYIINFATNILNSLKNALIGIIVSIYFLFSKEKLCAQVKKTVYAFFNGKRASRMVRITRKTKKTFEGFIIGKIIDSIIIGILTFFVLMIFKMPYYPLVAVIVGVTNVIPFFGPFIGAIPSAIIIFIADPVKSFWFIVIIFAIQQLDGNVIGPAILGDSTDMSALWVMFSIIFMSGVLGITGMFIGVPIFATLYALFVEYANKLLIARGKSRKLFNYYPNRYGRIKRKQPVKAE